MLLGHGPRPDATPYLAGEVSPPLPTASNHYSERDTLNMRRCVTLCDPGRQYLYKVQRVGGEVEKRRWWAGVCSPRNRNSGWQRSELFLSASALGAPSENVGAFRRQTTHHEGAGTF